MKKFFTLCCLLTAQVTYCQTGSVGIGTTTPNANAALDITATGKGLLIPRMDSLTRVNITNPPDGLMVFQTDHRKGFWYAISNVWLYIPDKVNSGDNLGSHTATQNLQMTDFDLRLRATSDANHGMGWYGASGSSKNWLGQNVDGPVLYGFGGGALGTKGGTARTVLAWKSNGRVGINNFDPQQTLDVAGTAQAQQFAYATPQTRSLTIPSDAFSSTDPGAYRAYRAVGVNGGAFSPALWLTGGTGGQVGYVSAPVTLPQGAIITAIEITGVNNDGTNVNPHATISAISIGANSYTVPFMATATITAESGSFQTISTPTNHVVNNPALIYKVVVGLNQNNGSTNFSAVRITYTISTVE